MKKKLISLATGSLLARFSAYTLYLLILTNMSHNFAITNRWNEIWSNIHTYVAELGCLALSFAIIIIFSFVTTKEKCDRRLFAFSSIVGVAFGGAVFNLANFIVSMYIAITDNMEIRYAANRLIVVIECLTAVAVALLIFKKLHKEKVK